MITLAERESKQAIDLCIEYRYCDGGCESINLLDLMPTLLDKVHSRNHTQMAWLLSTGGKALMACLA